MSSVASFQEKHPESCQLWPPDDLAQLVWDVFMSNVLLTIDRRLFYWVMRLGSIIAPFSRAKWEYKSGFSIRLPTPDLRDGQSA